MKVPILLWVSGMVVFSGLYFYGAFRHSREVNINVGDYDQIAYFLKAKEMKTLGPQVVGNRNQMPGYPFIQSLFYRQGMADEEFFRRGKRVNIMMSFGILLILYFIFLKNFSLLISANLILITAFTVFVFKASYFQPELLFYFLVFLSFLGMIRMFRKPSPPLGVVIGILLGAAHLIKAAVVPALLVFSSVFVIREILQLGKELRKRRFNKASFRQKSGPLISALFLVVFFIATIFPYILTSKKLYGRYFYNVNSTFAIWHDNWGQVKPYIEYYYSPRIKEVPKELLPGPLKYWREHSLGQIFHRLAFGGIETVLIAAMAYGYFEYFLAFFLCFLFLLGYNRKGLKQAIQKYPWLSAFLVLYFGLHFLLYSFYVPIAPGPRFSLAQFIPVMFVMALGSSKLSAQKLVKLGKRKFDLFKLVNLVLLAILLIDILTILTRKIVTIPGGG